MSALSTYELSFGAVCGICAGVFVKKGAKLVAFMLGGAFVMLQVCGGHWDVAAVLQELTLTCSISHRCNSSR